MKFQIVWVFAFWIPFFSCQGISHEEQPIAPKATDNTGDSTRIIGKRLRLTYPDFTAFESFQSDSTVSWTTVDIDGMRTKGADRIHYAMVEDYIHFVSWLTSDSMLVSQVIDTRGMKVYTFYYDAHEKYKNRIKKRAGTVRIVH